MHFKSHLDFMFHLLLKLFFNTMTKVIIEHTNPLEKCLCKLTCYQYYVFCLIFLSKAPLFWHILNLIFLSPPMDFTCDGAKNHCPCDNPKWDTSVFTATMQTKFGLYCENKWLIHFAHSVAYAGALFGCLLFGFLSDKFGRRIIVSTSYLLVAVAGSLISVMPNIYCFIVTRFVEGLGVGGGIVTTYVWCIEFCSSEYREIVTALFHITLNLGHVTISGVSYLLRHMDQFQLALSIPMFFFAGFRWMIIESPKWLMDNDRIDELIKGLKKICPQHCETMRDDVQAFNALRIQDGAQKLKFWHIFKHKELSLNFGCMAVNYFVCGMGYYGVSQFIGGMAGNIHLNVAISGVMVLPGTIMCVFFLGLFSRRNFLMVTNFLAGIFMIAVVFIPSNINGLKIAFACISNCFFFMSFIIAFLYGVELFPTSIRNSVLGVLSVLARVGQILVPPINSLPQIAAGVVFGVMAILGALMCIPLPETKNTELPSSLEDTKVINKNRLSQQSAGGSPKAGSSQKPK